MAHLRAALSCVRAAKAAAQQQRAPRGHTPVSSSQPPDHPRALGRGAIRGRTVRARGTTATQSRTLQGPRKNPGRVARGSRDVCARPQFGGFRGAAVGVRAGGPRVRVAPAARARGCRCGGAAGPRGCVCVAFCGSVSGPPARRRGGDRGPAVARGAQGQEVPQQEQDAEECAEVRGACARARAAACSLCGQDTHAICVPVLVARSCVRVRAASS